MRFFILSFLLILSQNLYSKTYTYSGISSYEGGECHITFESDGENIDNLDIIGEAKIWFPLAEDGSYDPQVTVEQEVPFNFMHEGQEFDLKMRKTLFGNRKIKYKIDFDNEGIMFIRTKIKLRGKSLDNLKSFKFKQKVKLSIFKLFQLNYDCKELVNHDSME